MIRFRKAAVDKRQLRVTKRPGLPRANSQALQQEAVMEYARGLATNHAECERGCRCRFFSTQLCGGSGGAREPKTMKASMQQDAYLSSVADTECWRSL